MLFNSFEFILFFPVVFILYWLLFSKNRVQQNLLLLLASFFFYGWTDWRFLFLILFSIGFNFFIGNSIHNTQSEKIKQRWLWLAVAINFGILGYFKYFNFFLDSINTTAVLFGGQALLHSAKILLPVGISFYTFQSISYTVEVYRGNMPAEKNFGRFALFVSFFPQLVAGPINRPQVLLPQVNNLKPLEADNLIIGARRILWGLFKKVVVADRLAFFVNLVYNNPESYHGLSILCATIFFAFQIYCDFSGYSDIAIGVAKMMGIDLMRNFNKPYFSSSIREFWSKWHISLSTWFRDYLYIPLGGNRVSKVKWYRNIFIVFLISGLWHGANWTYIIWGGLHGVYQVVESIGKARLKPIKNEGLRRVSNFFKIIANFVLVGIAWVFFRANTVNDAFYMIKSMFILKPGKLFLGEPPTIIGYALLAVFLLLAIEIGQEYFTGIKVVNNSRPAIRYAGYFFLIICILLIGVLNGGQFIYFQF